MHHINTTIRHDLYSVPRLLRLSPAFCLHAVQTTYSSSAAGCYRRYLFSLETLRKFGKFIEHLSFSFNKHQRSLSPQKCKVLYIYETFFLTWRCGVWTALLTSITITMLLSIVNWLYSRSRVVNSNERNEVRLELHWLFIFGLLMSKGVSNNYNFSTTL